MWDIGRKIIATALKEVGFNVVDIGWAPPWAFVEEAMRVDADIIGISIYLTWKFNELKEVIEGLKSAGIRDRVKIVIGGGAASHTVAKEYA